MPTSSRYRYLTFLSNADGIQYPPYLGFITPLNLKHRLTRPLILKHPVTRNVRLDGFALGKSGIVAVGRAVGSNWALVDLDLELGYAPSSEDNYALQLGMHDVAQIDTLFLSCSVRMRHSLFFHTLLACRGLGRRARPVVSRTHKCTSCIHLHVTERAVAIQQKQTRRGRNPTPYTPHPTPYAIHPKPETLNPVPQKHTRRGRGVSSRLLGWACTRGLVEESLLAKTGRVLLRRITVFPFRS